MSKFMTTPNAKAVPHYLNGVNQKLVKQAQEKARATLSIESASAIKSGRLTVAQFKNYFPQAIDHGQGNFEDGQTGAIWEERNGFIVRRADSSIRDVLKAINEKPEMTDEEYYRLIGQMNPSAGG